MSEESFEFGDDLDLGGDTDAAGDSADSADGEYALPTELTKEAALAEMAARGPAWAALVSEVLEANADRAAKEAARLAFVEAEQAAIGADDLNASILGISLQDEFVQELRFNDNAAFDAQLAAVYADASRSREEGGLGWHPIDGPLNAPNEREQAMLDNWRANRSVDPATVLAKVQADREERVTETLKREPGRADQLGLTYDKALGKYLPVTPVRSAADLTTAEFNALQAAATGASYSLPEGHTRESWNALVAPFLGGAG